jgi:hypothetical protein
LSVADVFVVVWAWVIVLISSLQHKNLPHFAPLRNGKIVGVDKDQVIEDGFKQVYP